jgi:hypothetical protein
MNELLKEFLEKIFVESNEVLEEAAKNPEQEKFDNTEIEYSYKDRKTGKQVQTKAKVSTIKKAGKSHPAWPKYQQMLGQQQKKQPDKKQQGKVGQKPAPAQTAKPARPVQKTGAQKEKGGAAQPTGKKLDTKEVYKAVYGRSGKLLLDSPMAQQILEKGFVPGEGAPPGSAGSNFNENMSNEGSLILQRYPDLSDEQLARILFERTRKTKLGAQQADPSVKGTETYTSEGKARIDVPSDITDPKEKTIYRNCVVTARSGRKKYARALNGVKAAQQSIGFGKIKEYKAYGGAKSELDAAKKMVQGAKRAYVFDEEMGLVEIPKETLVEWINSSGGGKNAADTVQITTDNKGNLIYDGWSDKKTLADIQGNSSLNDEYTKMTEQVLDMEDSKRISEKDADNARAILLSAQRFSDELEDKYADTSAQLSDHFLRTPKAWDTYVKIAKSRKDVVGKFSGFVKKVQKSLKTAGGSATDKKIRELYAEGKKKYSGDKLVWYVLNKMAEAKMLSGDERKILERVAASTRDEIMKKNNGVLPKQFEGLEIKSTLRRLRGEAIVFQQEVVDKLNKIKVKNSHGDVVKLGDHLKALEIANILHLEKIEVPKKPKSGDMSHYHEQALVRSTHLMMEGIPVDPKTIRGCLGVSTVREFEKNFEVVTAASGAKDALDGTPEDGVEGSTVYIYALGKGGKRTLVARKAYRSKQGDTGKTGTTIQWEPDMYKCFDKKAAQS